MSKRRRRDWERFPRLKGLFGLGFQPNKESRSQRKRASVNTTTIEEAESEEELFGVYEAKSTPKDGPAVVNMTKKPLLRTQRRFKPELLLEIEVEVNKLLAAGFIRRIRSLSQMTDTISVNMVTVEEVESDESKSLKRLQSIWKRVVKQLSRTS